MKPAGRSMPVHAPPRRRIEVRYTPRGAAWRLMTCTAPEILIEGPAGTGKTRAVCELDDYLCRRYDRLRIMWLRLRRVDMAESVLNTYENIVLQPGDPIKSGAGRRNRHSYEYPNGSQIVVCGLNEPDKYRSTEYGLIRVFEASEVLEEAYEMLTHRLRQPAGSTLPYTQILCDTNPDSPAHWLNLRADRRRLDGSPMMQRLCSTHKDNPMYWDAGTKDWTPEGRRYVLDKLANLSGVRRERYYLGRWAAAENAIWPEYSRAKHHLAETPTKRIRWYFASVDWGFRNPGTIQVWGVDGDNNAYLVHEVYYRERTIDWWRDIAVALQRIYNIRIWICDGENPEHIYKFREAGLATREADKDVKHGLEIVRVRLSQGRVFFCDDALDEPDASLMAEKKPISLTQEIWSYTYPPTLEGKPIKEEPAANSIDHGCDAFRYAMMFLDRYDLGDPLPKPTFKEDQIGHYLRDSKAFSLLESMLNQGSQP